MPPTGNEPRPADILPPRGDCPCCGGSGEMRRNQPCEVCGGSGRDRY